MRDYRESIPRGASGGVPRGQKRSQFKRLFGIMGGMIFAFAVFIVGVRVGIQMERERVRIAQEATSPMTAGKEVNDKSKASKASPAPEKKDDTMRFTFYETLTKKEGAEKGAQQKEKETTAKKEQANVTAKKEVKGVTPPVNKKLPEGKEAPKERYFVQIASFKEKEAAEGLKGRLVKKGYTVQLIPVQIEGIGLWYRVRLGGYTTRQEAQTVQKRIAVEENIEGTKVVSGP